MKKFFLIVFTLFVAMIFYQLILSKNGIIEGYRIEEEKKAYQYYKNILTQERDRLKEYIQFIKNDKDSLLYFANKLGFYKEDHVKVVKILDDIEKNSSDNINLELLQKNFDNMLKENSQNKFLDRIKLITTILFFIFFGFFIFISVFGIKDNK